MEGAPTKQDQINEIKNLIDSTNNPAEESDVSEPVNTQSESANTQSESAPDVSEPEEVQHDENIDPSAEESESSDGEEAPKETDTDFEFPTDLTALAEAIEVTPEELYNVQIKMPDGQEPITIGELKNEYSEAKREQERLQTTITEQKELIEQAQTGIGQTAQVSQAKITLMGQLESIKAEYQSTNWPELEASDAGAAALLRQKFQEANAEVGGQLQYINQNERQQQTQLVQRTAQQTVDLIPEWKDDAVRTSAIKNIETLLAGEGMTPQQASRINDPISVKLLNELATLRANAKAAEESVKVVRKAPKVLRSNSRQKVNASKQTDALIAKAKATGTRQDEVNAVKAILKGG